MDGASVGGANDSNSVKMSSSFVPGIPSPLSLTKYSMQSSRSQAPMVIVKSRSGCLYFIEFPMRFENTHSRCFRFASVWGSLV